VWRDSEDIRTLCVDGKSQPYIVAGATEKGAARPHLPFDVEDEELHRRPGEPLTARLSHPCPGITICNGLAPPRLPERNGRAVESVLVRFRSEIDGGHGVVCPGCSNDVGLTLPTGSRERVSIDGVAIVTLNYGQFVLRARGHGAIA
jgi:hypothetical protein